MQVPAKLSYVVVLVEEISAAVLETLKIYTADLELGMFVSSLDKSWLDSTFLIQGFKIENREQVDRLRKECEFVLIDTKQSRQRAGTLERKVKPMRVAKNEKRPDRARIPVDRIFEGRSIKPYQDNSEFIDEHPRAQLALNTLLGDVCDIFEEVSEGGKINVIKLRKSVEPVIDSISRNPDACLWVARMRQHDQYSYQHSLGASLWAVSLGRQMGLPRHDLRSLAVGAMLMDVGKLRVDTALLQAERKLSPAENETMRMHITHGMDIIEEGGMMNQDVIDMVGCHHERYDGSGYPKGLSRDQIPPVARIAAIVDTYDAMTTPRAHAKAMSPSAAIKMIYEARDRLFQAELVEAFIQAIGIYPAGTLVELSTGEIGVVVAEYRTRRLRPRVLLLLDKHKDELSNPVVVDLQANSLENGQPPPDIVRALEPGAHNLDLSRISFKQ
ncbi:MAG: HD-GYP domain-containing protein (c-di-GMP phosphodiesterase class II) [Halieaceae bacterium]